MISRQLLGFQRSFARLATPLKAPRHYGVAHARERRAFEGKSGRIGGMGVARRAAKSEHRIGLLRLEIRAAEKTCIFVGLEVGKPHDYRLRIERAGDGADPFRQPLDEEIGGLRIVSRQFGDGGADLRRFDLARRYAR